MTELQPSIVWADILDDIRDQQCVLFVGPEIVRTGDNLMQEALRDYIIEHCTEGQIVQDYKRDGFFLFRDAAVKTNARRYLKRFYRDHTIDEGIFKRILEMPFHLVVSINADTFLDDIAYQYGVRHRFGYFKSRNRAADEVETPSSSIPLFYNLCGCKNQDDSLLLDYEDLFQLLQSALGTPGLPQKLMESLNAARTFVFLGFQFDKWHSQLLLRLLQGGRNDLSNLSVKTRIPDDDTRAFLINQFQIQFLGDQFNFFDALYDHCDKAKMLRRIAAPLNGDASDVMHFVQNNSLEKALDLLADYSHRQNHSVLAESAALLMSRFRHWSNENDKGKIDSRDALVERNRIADAILELARQLR